MQNMTNILDKLGLTGEERGGFAGEWMGSGPTRAVISPVNGDRLGSVAPVSALEFETILSRCYDVSSSWKMVPAPERGRVVKELGKEIALHAEALAALVTAEMGKCLRESRGEVQEMLDIVDFAVGLSRQLYGLTMPSERSRHRIQEQWHPLGVAGVITAFNFPVAVWAWNTALSLVCGNTVLWKPSSNTPLTAIACTRMAERVLSRNGYSTEICSLAVGPGSMIGDRITRDSRVALVSYTGSVYRGRKVGAIVQKRFGRHILELGGNNAVIVTPSADMDIAIRSVYFGAIGTAGQRCTSTRRVIIHESIYPAFVERLKTAYGKTRLGDPIDDENLMGPLVDSNAVDAMMTALDTIKEQGGTVLLGGEKQDLSGGCYVTPCLVEVPENLPIVRLETFAPILYLMKYTDFDDAIALHNDVPQGLSSAIITNDLLETEMFLGPGGSDCGMANVNTGTSGAEIGGAFGGEKETGGGRESGSDSWKGYMRRLTSAINFSGEVTLAQNIQFDI